MGNSADWTQNYVDQTHTQLCWSNIILCSNLCTWAWQRKSCIGFLKSFKSFNVSQHLSMSLNVSQCLSMSLNVMFPFVSQCLSISLNVSLSLSKCLSIYLNISQCDYNQINALFNPHFDLNPPSPQKSKKYQEGSRKNWGLSSQKLK